MLHVWIDQDLCTGDGLCTDHCPELFVLLEDGISYVVDPDGRAMNDPGGAESLAPVPRRHVDAGMIGVSSGDYMGAHWLASFAALALTGA